MRRPLLTIVLAFLAPLALLPLNVGGCVPGDTSSGRPLFNLSPTVIIRVVPDPARGVAPLFVNFDSSDSTDDGVIVRRVWDFGDGTTSEDIAPLHVFESNGEYTVRLTLTDEQGATNSATKKVTVTERPVADFTITYVPDDPSLPPVPGQPTADAAPATFQFDASASYDPDGEEGDVLRYLWEFGDGARDVLPILPHRFGRPGTYRVKLSVTDATGVIGTTEKIVSVGIRRPEITFRAPQPGLTDVVCSEDSPLWVQVVYEVEPGVPIKLRAGLDGDRNSATANDIQLDEDANDGVVVNDLNLTLPTALDIPAGTTAGEYFLWVELSTNQTTPQRVYADPSIHVVTPFPSTIAAATVPILPNTGDTNPEWHVMLPATSTQQIFDVGPVNVGDRLFLSLLEAPGYNPTYSYGDYNLLILDDQQALWAWYGNDALFTPDAQLVVGAANSSFLFVVNTSGSQPVPGIKLQLQRIPTSIVPTRTQYVHLVFTASSSVAVGGSAPFEIPEFDYKGAGRDEVIMGNIFLRVKDRLQDAGYNFVISQSTPAAPAAPPAVPHNTIYFDVSGLTAALSNLSMALPDRNGDGWIDDDDYLYFGLSSFVDPRNETLTGKAAIDVYYLETLINNYRASLVPPQLDLSDNELARALANAALHHIGFMSGLRETTGRLGAVAVADIMDEDPLAADAELYFVTADLAGITVGRQNAPAYLQDVFR